MSVNIAKKIRGSSHVVDARIALNKRINRDCRKGNVAVFYAGRCGATLLGHLLDQHPDVCWGGELFHRADKKYGHYACFEKEPLKVLEFKMFKRRCKYYGFESKAMKEMHLRPGYVNMGLRSYVRGLKALGFNKFIVLKRKNYLKRVACSRISRDTRRWVAHIGEDVSLKRVYIDPKKYKYGMSTTSILSHFERMDDYYLELASVLDTEPVLNLNYEEDIESNPLYAYHKTCAYLGIEAFDVNVHMQKIDPYKMSDYIVNYDELKALLRNTKYEWMLNE